MIDNPEVNRNSRLPTVLVLASGRGERFTASGGLVHKLQALLGSKTVLQHTMDAVAASGLPWHLESAPHPGMGDAIAAAVRATKDAAGWLILPADLPLVRPATLCAVAEQLAHHVVVVPSFKGVRGHPVGFSPLCCDALLNLEGKQGAVQIVRSYYAMNMLAIIDVEDEGIVTDIDTLEDLKLAEFLIAQRG